MNAIYIYMNAIYIYVYIYMYTYTCLNIYSQKKLRPRLDTRLKSWPIPEVHPIHLAGDIPPVTWTILPFWYRWPI